jgi:hypothetical protein
MANFSRCLDVAFAGVDVDVFIDIPTLGKDDVFSVECVSLAERVIPPKIVGKDDD